MTRPRDQVSCGRHRLDPWRDLRARSGSVAGATRALDKLAGDR